MWAAWGPDLIVVLQRRLQRDTLQAKHPWALGRPADEVWAEIWDDIGPRIQSVLDTGVATWDEDLLLFLERSGYPEETYHTFSYSPVDGDDGRTDRHALRRHGEHRPRRGRAAHGEPPRPGGGGRRHADRARRARRRRRAARPATWPTSPSALTYLFDATGGRPDLALRRRHRRGTRRPRRGRCRPTTRTRCGPPREPARGRAGARRGPGRPVPRPADRGVAAAADPGGRRADRRLGPGATDR